MKARAHTRGPLRALALGVALCLSVPPQLGPAATAQGGGRTLLGLKLGAEASAWLSEVEGRLGKEVYAEFAELDPPDAGGDFTLGTSYLTRTGTPVLRVDESVRAGGPRQVEAVVGHELLHLRLRARGYPLFLFAPDVMTRRGPAEEVEQSNVNDLVSMIEHRAFAAEMRRTGFDRLVDLTNWLDTARRRGRDEDGQAEMLNYARAELEWDDPAKLGELARIYRANGWARSLAGGRRLAGIIRASNLDAPAAVAPVFRRCMAVLYNADFRVEPDRRFALARIHPQMLIRAPRRPRRR